MYSRWSVLPPVFILAFLMMVVVAAGEMRLERYFLTTILVFVITCFAVIYEFGMRIRSEVQALVKPPFGSLFFSVGAVLICFLIVFNSVVRYDNRWPWRIPYLPQSFRMFISNYGDFAYEMNRQYVPFLMIKKKAIQDVEAAYKKNPDLRIVTNYPMNQALAFRSAGYLAELESIPTRSASNITELFADDLDLVIHVKSMYAGTDGLSLETLKQIDGLELYKEYIDDDVWKTTITIFRRKNSGVEVP